MIFQLGRGRGEHPVQDETLKRWRERTPSASQPREKSPLRAALEVASQSREAADDWSLDDEPEPPLRAEEPQPGFAAGMQSALGPGTFIEGKFSFDSPVRIDGILRGEVSSSSTLVVGEHAVVDAVIDVGKLIVLGEVRGHVHASETVEIQRGGSLEADIEARHLVVQDGGHFNGYCKRLS